MAAQVTLANDHFSATIAAKGAELVSLMTAGGAELMWSADPAVWGWHAPNLFPIVGRLAGDTLVHAGRRYPMKQHGFLRHSLCELVSEEAGACAFRLTDNPDTRAQYPFAFALTVQYRLDGRRLECGFTLENPADEPLFASLGAHPGFRWPIAGAPRDEHAVLFEKPEPEPIRLLDGGLLALGAEPSPVNGRVLRLDDALFARDALIFDRLSSRRVTYGAPGGPGIAIDFADFSQFGIWSKPDAGFVCLEPWQGTASPVGYDGEFSAKPGVVMILPGARRVWRYGISLLAHMPELG